MVKKLQYHHVDVFTDMPFGGNQLAVFLDPPGDIDPALMQAIAKEMNFSESTFVFPPRDSESDYYVRIFTPGRELPMAGHPTVGTAFVLQHQGEIPAEGMVRFEEGVGVIPVKLEAQGDQVMIMMKQPSPKIGPSYDDRARVAAVLSLETDQLMSGYPLEVISCGVPFLYVPLRDLDAVRMARPRLDMWDDVFGNFASATPFVFSSETEDPALTVHSRMFAPTFGILEDPATGSASGPLGVYLVRHGLAAPGTFISEQGYEMGRASLITIEIQQQEGEFSHIGVGGITCYMGAGFLEV